MNRSSEDMQRLMDRFRDVIRGAGVKMTAQRIAIYREAARTADHPNIEEIFKTVRRTMPTVSLDTVYRTLDLFKALGLVSILRPLPDRIRIDANTEPHHHFVCTSCGAIRDFRGPGLDGLKIPEAAGRLGRAQSARLELLGVCADCSKSGKSHGPDGMRSHRIKAGNSRRD